MVTTKCDVNMGTSCYMTSGYGKYHMITCKFWTDQANLLIMLQMSVNDDILYSTTHCPECRSMCFTVLLMHNSSPHGSNILWRFANNWWTTHKQYVLNLHAKLYSKHLKTRLNKQTTGSAEFYRCQILTTQRPCSKGHRCCTLLANW